MKQIPVSDMGNRSSYSVTRANCVRMQLRDNMITYISAQQTTF